MRKKRETHTHTHAMNKKKRMREITTTKMCSNQQPKNRNNVFNELAPTMKYRTKKMICWKQHCSFKMRRILVFYVNDCSKENKILL